MRFCKVPEKVMKLSKIVRFAGSLQALAQLVQQAEQLGVLLRGEQGHKILNPLLYTELRILERILILPATCEKQA